MIVKRARPGPRSEERRERLIGAGYEVMRQQGLANLRTRDVAAKAGITVATLHYYFPTKDALVRAVIEHAITARMLIPLELDQDRADGPQALRTMVDGLVEQAKNDPGHFRLLHELIWRSHDDEALSTMLIRWHEGWHQSVKSWLLAGQETGQFRPDLDPDKTASLIVHAVLGMVMRPPGLDTNLSSELERLLARS